MYQSDVQRFERSKNTDLFVTFFPLVLAFGLRGFLLKTAFRRRPSLRRRRCWRSFWPPRSCSATTAISVSSAIRWPSGAGAATPRSRSPLSGSVAKSRGFTSGSCAVKCFIWPRRMSAARRMGSPRLPTASRSFPPGAPAGSITGRRGPSTARPFIRTNGRPPSCAGGPARTRRKTGLKRPDHVRR